MAAGERSLSNVLQDVIRNVQEIIRSEVRLAKTGIREELVKARSSTVLFAAGAVTLVLGILYLLLAIVHAMALGMPIWAAALIVGATLAVGASAMLAVSLKRFKEIHSTPNAQLKQ
jgi:hypothetical protein